MNPIHAAFGMAALTVVALGVVLIGDALRRWRCPHNTVRLVRQQQGESIYFAEVCMDCQKAEKVKP